MEKEIHDELNLKMENTIDALDREFKKIRTGRASTALLDGIKVDCYDTQMPLDQVASLSVPESRLITIKPWDQSVIGEIEKAILKSELGLTPMNDGKIIRIPIPPLTEERRKELAKLAKKMAEESKIAARSHRRDANDLFKELKNDKEISEDDMYKNQDEVQKMTDDFIKMIDEVTAEKEKEIIEFMKVWMKIGKIESIELSEMKHLKAVSSVFPIAETLARSSSGYFLVHESKNIF